MGSTRKPSLKAGAQIATQLYCVSWHALSLFPLYRCCNLVGKRIDIQGGTQLRLLEPG